MIFEKKGSFAFILITAVLFLYLLLINWSSKPFIDIWPLEGILWKTIVTIVVVAILSCILLRNGVSIIIPVIIQTFLVVVIPVLRYPNSLNIIGAADSSAHFSFAKWIVVNGHVDTAGNLYYSDCYGFHPGNGIIPAVLSLVSSINLGWSMNAVLVTIYSVYMLFLLVTLKILRQPMLERIRVAKALWLIAIFTIAIRLPVYYGGVELGYVYAANLLYILIKWLLNKGATPFKEVATALIVFWGLLFTHYSTTVIVVAYILTVTLALITVSLSNDRFGAKRRSWGLPVLALLMLSISITYEIYVDVILLRNTFREALSHLYLPRIRELEKASMAAKVKGLSLIDLLRYLVGCYAKTVIVLGIILIHTVMLLKKWRSLSSDEKMIAFLLFASYLTWIISWSALGSFLTGARALSVICFLLTLSFILTHEKLYRFLIKRTVPFIPLVLVVLGFITNFGLPIMPTIRGDGDLYTYPTFSQGGISEYALHPTMYISSYASINSSPFLCLAYYTSFGLCDLMWHVPKIPRHGSIGLRVTSPDSIIEHIKSYLNGSGESAIVPQPLRDSLLFGPIGYKSFYEKPFQFLSEKGKALMYNNGFYTVFLA